ncbi:hypothetical protein TNCV_595961 [Trichonephila clavipes]|uniref:Uncharacterized protein n=1 Tax=Trichonephila clavipes TaxID=2585209 RepID=A0A8X6R7G0_TRICX|nr:hypothetical protein TNCV_595961 [Trichonephila clavipes]
MNEVLKLQLEDVVGLALASYAQVCWVPVCLSDLPNIKFFGEFQIVRAQVPPSGKKSSNKPFALKSRVENEIETDMKKKGIIEKQMVRGTPCKRSKTSLEH